jgi:5-methylthioribose kinase
MFLLDPSDLSSLTSYLYQQNVLLPQEQIVFAEKPGEGNMNHVLRVSTGARTFIIKQSRGYVEKYPQIAAPAERVLTEGEFYNITNQHAAIKNHSPALLGVDKENNIILIEDFGKTSDFTFLYNLENKIETQDILALTNYLSYLHNTFYKKNPDDTLSNRKMRVLNHEHIFIYPFLDNNDFNLDDIQFGLKDVAMKYKQDELLKRNARLLGEKYLDNGLYLLHGDFYPGSWLRTKNGIKIIDPEFCFFGPAEFDIGVMVAHLMIASQNKDILQQVMANYNQPKGFSVDLMNRFVGIEILRRMIGLAQLPVKHSLKGKRKLLEEAYLLLVE